VVTTHLYESVAIAGAQNFSGKKKKNPTTFAPREQLEKKSGIKLFNGSLHSFSH